MKIRDYVTQNPRSPSPPFFIGGGPTCPGPGPRSEELPTETGPTETAPLTKSLRAELTTRAPLKFDAGTTAPNLSRAPKPTTTNFFEAAAHIVPRIFTAETSAVAATDGFRRADLKLGIDLGRFRDMMTPHLSSKSHSLLESTADFVAANAWDLIGSLGSIISEKLGQDISGSGYYRMRQDIRDHRLFGVRAEGFEWKDGNFGSSVNTLHGLPYALLGSGYMRMRGYSPEVALLTGMVANILVHELFFERYEQPKSIYDMALMNTMGAIFGALPGCGMEAQWSLFSGQPTATFYVEDGDNRYSIAFEQQRDFFKEGVPIEQRPVLPWHVELGASIRAEQGLELGLRLRLTTDENEQTNAWDAIQGVGIGASIRYRIP